MKAALAALTVLFALTACDPSVQSIKLGEILEVTYTDETYSHISVFLTNGDVYTLTAAGGYNCNPGGRLYRMPSGKLFCR